MDVNTVPVKLLKPRNDLRKKHIDGHFAMASVKQADELTEVFPAETVLYISQNDKAKAVEEATIPSLLPFTW